MAIPKLTPAQRDAITAASRTRMGLDKPQQFATSSPGPGWVYDSQAVGWWNPTGAPGMQSFVSGVPGSQAGRAQAMTDYTTSGTAGFGITPRQAAIQTALAAMTPEQRAAAIARAQGGAQPGGLLSTGGTNQNATQNPLLHTPVIGNQQAMAAGDTGPSRQQQVQAALAAMPPQVRQMMVQRALMMQGGVPGAGAQMPGQFQPPSMGSFGGGMGQPGLPPGWGGAGSGGMYGGGALSQPSYIPPMQMVNPGTGQPMGVPMFGRGSPSPGGAYSPPTHTQVPIGPLAGSSPSGTNRSGPLFPGSDYYGGLIFDPSARPWGGG